MKNASGYTRISQIAILTHNVEKAARHWGEYLGMPTPEIVISDGFEKTGALYRGEPCHALLYQAFFEFENIQMEIIQPVDDTPSIWRECLDRNGEGLHHISFEVKDMPRHIENCADKDMPLMQKGEYQGGRYAYFDARDNLNIILEMVEND